MHVCSVPSALQQAAERSVSLLLKLTSTFSYKADTMTLKWFCIFTKVGGMMGAKIVPVIWHVLTYLI